jgi:hypothetical protein
VNEQQPAAAKMDANDLWKEEVFTDRKIGVIRRSTPVKSDGSPDLSRKVAFTGEASLMTPAGTLPLAFEIPASDLSAAAAAYGDCLEKAFKEAMEELQEMRRRASSQIVVPKGGIPDLGAGGGFPPGGGKLKL